MFALESVHVLVLELVTAVIPVAPLPITPVTLLPVEVPSNVSVLVFVAEARLVTLASVRFAVVGLKIVTAPAAVFSVTAPKLRP